METAIGLVDAESAGDTRLTLDFKITDTGESFGAELRNSILEKHPEGVPVGADAVVSISTAAINQVSRGEKTFRQAATIVGDRGAPDRFDDLLDRGFPAIYMHDR